MKKLALISWLLFACLVLGAVWVGAAQPPSNSASAAAARKKKTSSKHTKKVKSHKASLKTVSTRTRPKRRYRHYRYRRYRYRGPLHPSRDRVTEIQSALARGGYYQGDPNGKWDARTIGAMRSFQEDHGLDGTGKIDALSLQKLGLGSEIAGVDAPRQPLPAAGTVTPAAPASTTTDPVKAKPQTPQVPQTPQTQTPKSPTPGTGSGSAAPSAPGPSPAPATSTTSPKVSSPQLQ